MTPPNMDNVLRSVYDIIKQRLKERPDKSYVVSLADKGLEKILSKISEESNEVIDAARETTEKQARLDHLNYEICDLFFHTLVLAAYEGIDYTSIEAELARRFGVSGITEKESRTQKNDDKKKGNE